MGNPGLTVVCHLMAIDRENTSRHINRPFLPVVLTASDDRHFHLRQKFPEEEA